LCLLQGVLNLIEIDVIVDMDALVVALNEIR
jgi:hypothetical protein